MNPDASPATSSPSIAVAARVDGERAEHDRRVHEPRVGEPVAQERIARQLRAKRRGRIAQRRVAGGGRLDEADVRQGAGHRRHTDVASAADVHLAERLPIRPVSASGPTFSK